MTSDSEMSSKLLHEISERNSSEFNVIVYDLPESNSPPTNHRISDDFSELSSALSPIQIDLPTDIKFSHLYRTVYKSPLPPPQLIIDNIGIKPFSFLPSRLTIELNDVEENLLSLRTTKSHGPDGVSAQLIFNIRTQLKYPLLFLFNLSLAEGIFPSIWKTSQVTPIYKSGDPGSVFNYRPISGLPLIGKLFENIVT